MNTKKPNFDDTITFLEALMLTRLGQNPSDAIENQEKRGQQNVVANKRLPKKANEHSVPRDIRQLGITKDMEWQTQREIMDQNIISHTRVQYEKMGIEIIDDYDDLFWNVKLPEGWEVKATDHTMWNDLFDAHGRKRGTFFYKAAFYDRSAFINFETRFHAEVTHDCDPDEDYEIWSKADLVGVVKDCGKVIYRTKTEPVPGDYTKETKINESFYEELEAFLAKEYPDYENIHAYWD